MSRTERTKRPRSASAPQTESAVRPHSLRVYLIRLMLFFLAAVLLVTWVFQVLLLNVVYESVRKQDLERAAAMVASALGAERLNDTVYDLAVESLMGIAVYRLDGDRVTLVTSKAAIPGEEAFFMTNERIFDLCRKTEQADGGYHSKVTFGGQEVQHSYFPNFLPDRDNQADGAVTPQMVHLIYAEAALDDQGNRYLILLNAELEPLTLTVRTLKIQFLWIFGILLALILVFSYLFSRWVSRPIRQMNEAAKQLAHGNYNADFSLQNGYLETQELAESLNYAADELSRADQMQKELIANISHDLRTPLTMIRGYGETMRDIPGENTPENIQILIDEAEHLSELVNDLLDLSKIQSGVQCPVMEFFDLTSAIRDVMERYEAFTKVQGIRIVLQAAEAVPVFADRSMILQVIYNLINNAIHYIGEDRQVTVIQTVQNRSVRITVQDRGEGIPQEQLPLIWDRYYKVEGVHRMAKIGTGLGLSIVKGILEVHNATYGVDSKVGEGSSFWFELPISEPPQNPIDFR